MAKTTNTSSTEEEVLLSSEEAIKIFALNIHDSFVVRKKYSSIVKTREQWVMLLKDFATINV